MMTDFDQAKFLVTPPGCDDVGAVLNQLGDGFRYDVVTWDMLLDANVLNNCDALFLNCSESALHYAEMISGTIQNFVRTGGSLYGSGEACAVIEVAFSGMVEFAQEGRVQSFDCQVVDAERPK